MENYVERIFQYGSISRELCRKLFKPFVTYPLQWRSFIWIINQGFIRICYSQIWKKSWCPVRKEVFKSPRYTGVDYMFLYRSIYCRCRHCWSRSQMLVHVITLQQPFNNFLDFLYIWHNYWPWPIDYLVKFWSIFVLSLTLNFQSQLWDLLYLSQNGSIPPKWKANILIELNTSNVTIKFYIGHDLDLEFSRSNVKFVISQQNWFNCHERKIKYIGRIGHNLDLEFFDGHILNMLYLK